MTAAVSEGLLARAQSDELSATWRLASRIRNASMLVRGRPSDSLPTHPRDRVGVAYLCGYGTDDASKLVDDYKRLARRASGIVDQLFWT